MDKDKVLNIEDFPTSLKKTPTRLRLWDLLSNQNIPLDCSSIYEALRKVYGDVSFSTVYRTLETLVELGYLEKTQLSHQEGISYQKVEHKDIHYAVCLSCHKLVEFARCPFENESPHLVEKNFQMVGHKVEILGYCEACRDKMK